MRTVLAIGIFFLMAGSIRAAGPILEHKDPDTQREFINVYQDIRKGSANLKGTTANDEAPAGYWREWSTGTWGGTNNGLFANSAPSTQYTAFSTVTIPSAGDWMVCGTIQGALNGATMTRSQIALSQFFGNTTTDHATGKNAIDIAVPTAASNAGSPFCWRFETTAASTVYVKAAATFSAGQPQYLGFGWAERRR